MKKIISLILAISLLAVFAVPVFADEESNKVPTFESIFASVMPRYMFNNAEFEAGKYYTLFVSTPTNQDYFEADNGAFAGIRGVILEKNITPINADIVTVEEDENFNYIITFYVREEGEFAFEIKMRTFGYDIFYEDYRYIEGDDWVYTIKTEPITALPSSVSDYSYDPSAVAPPSKPSSSTDSVVSFVDSTSSADTQVDNEPEKISVWVWVAIAVAVVGCGAVVVIISRKKLIK